MMVPCLPPCRTGATAGHLAVFTTQVPHEGSDLAVKLMWVLAARPKPCPVEKLEAHDMIS